MDLFKTIKKHIISKCFKTIKKHIISKCFKDVSLIRDWKIDIVIMNVEFSIRYRPFDDTILVEMPYNDWNCIFLVNEIEHKFKDTSELCQALIAYTWCSYVKNIEVKGNM